MEEIGGYRLVRRIGAGGMGTVWEAVGADGRAVALKLLHPHISRDPSARARLVREVDLLHRVRGRGVARVLDAEVEGDEAFVVTELIDGPTLEDDVAAHGPFTTPELANLAHGLADALHAIHRVGVVHRDLKPGNVMLPATGPVLIDFGIAQVADDTRLTQVGMVTGTPGYLDPEVVDGAPPSPSCDWWAWAAVLVFAATGRKPFGTGPAVAVLSRMSQSRVDLDGVDPLAATALWAALQPDRRHRLDPNAVLSVLDGRWQEADLREALAALGIRQRGAIAASDATMVLSGGAPPTLGAPAGSAPTMALPATAPATYAPVGPPRRDVPATVVTPAGGWQQQSPTATRVLPQGVPPAVRTDRGAPAGWVEPGAPAAWDGDAQPVPAWATPAAPQRGVVAAVGLFVVAAAGTWPGVALLLLAALMLLSATVGYAGRAMRRARFRKGVRRGDAARAVASSPWFLVRAAVVTVLLLVLAGGSAWIALQVGGFSLTPEMLGTWREVRANVLLWASAALFAVVAWFGPGSGIQREGARSVLGAVLPYPAMRVTLATLCVLLALGFVIAAMTGALPAPTWQPLPVTPTA